VAADVDGADAPVVVVDVGTVVVAVVVDAGTVVVDEAVDELQAAPSSASATITTPTGARPRAVHRSPAVDVRPDLPFWCFRPTSVMSRPLLVDRPCGCAPS
jgi:hypothetical protein